MKHPLIIITTQRHEYSKDKMEIINACNGGYSMRHYKNKFKKNE